MGNSPERAALGSLWVMVQQRMRRPGGTAGAGSRDASGVLVFWLAATPGGPRRPTRGYCPRRLRRENIAFLSPRTT